MKKLNRLKYYRNMLGLTQEQMCNIIGLKNKQNYSLKETGKIKFNDLEKIKIKNVINEKYPDVTIDELFF